MRTPIPNRDIYRETERASKVKKYTLPPEELAKYQNLPIPTDSNGKKLRKTAGVDRIDHKY